ncbi:MAG: hypothetical protein ACI9LO_001992 [Planctomycetota bacterium]|jgi:hypothetical protein
MFDPINIPFGAKMLFNVVKLKPGVEFDDVELLIGEMCHAVKETYSDDQGGFIAGQVFKYSGFISAEGSLHEDQADDQGQQDHIAIVTYWKSFEQHETSHADETFKLKFDALVEHCNDAYELGYDMLWQGAAE